MRNGYHRHLIFITLAAALLSSNPTLATSYVTFNDGHLLVFPDSCLQGTSTTGGYLSFTALDGTEYAYPLTDIQSVEQQLTKELPTILSYEFDNKFNYQVFTDATGDIDGDAISVEVAGIGKWLTASFNLSDGAARAWIDGVDQVSQQSRMRFDHVRVYTVGYPGDFILAQEPSGGYALMPYGRQYTVTVDFLTDHSTTVPRIDINTVGGVNISSKTQYVDAEIIIDGAGVFPSMTDSVQIRGRGNNSWTNNPDAKNPYRLKFAEKVKPFGLSKGKNWILLANRIKGSMLTNAIGMKAASLLGTVAANHIVPVDLYINGTYKGSYNFTEKVGFAGNSVDLDDESAAALLELDLYYDSANGQKFRSTPYNLPVNIKKPEFSEGTTLLTLNDIKRRFNAFVAALQNQEDLTAVADMDLLARYFLFNCYICNLELYHPKSTYCYYENVLDDSSLLNFGPAWDLDWAFGFDGSYSSSYFGRNIEYDYFRTMSGMSQSAFTSSIGNHPQMPSRMYQLLKAFMANGLEELCDYCHDYYDYAKPSFMNNKAASLDTYDYAAQVDKAVNWLHGRAAFLRGEFRKQCELRGDVNNDREITVADVTSLIDIILGGYADADTQWRSDVNCDNEITLADINALINWILEN